MKRSQASSLLGVLVALVITLPGCGDNRSLQSVNVSPPVASSKAQFTATGIYNKTPASVDITGSTTWCVGSSDGICAGNIVAGATVSSGLAQCVTGFTGRVTILAGQGGLMANPDTGVQLKPFGTAQLNCP